MPFWLQLTAALSAALASGIMGAALVPFLRKLRMCEPEAAPKTSEEAAGERLRPTMGGVLLVFGCLFGLALSFALYQNFCIADRTSSAFQRETSGLICIVGYSICTAAAGFCLDWFCVRRRLLKHVPALYKAAVLFLLHLGLLLLYHHLTGSEFANIMDFGFRRVDAGIWYYPLTAALLTLLWMCGVSMEGETDGVSVTTGGVLLLSVTVILMDLAQPLHVLFALTAAGSCMGCLIWNLHPAKCRIGRTGTYWLTSAVIGCTLLSGQYLTMLLLPAVYVLNQLPAWKPGNSNKNKPAALEKRMKQAGMNPWQRIGVLTGFAVFCGIAAVLAYQ